MLQDHFMTLRSNWLKEIDVTKTVGVDIILSKLI